MTMKDKRKNKAIKGLNSCSGGDLCGCDGCPYNDMPVSECIEALHEDVLGLLKASHIKMTYTSPKMSVLKVVKI